MAPSQRTGLTLTLPPLKGGKLAKKPQPIPEKPKISRPVKLKPLKEVLARLIAQIRRGVHVHLLDFMTLTGRGNFL
jgi:hypothetical protein